MTFDIGQTARRVAQTPAARQAADAGEELIALWPLDGALRMDNDARYAENLQVRLSRAIARTATGEDVTAPDAEFVYEGAESIPGRSQEIVDALLAANDAIDALADYHESFDLAALADAADTLDARWDQETTDAVGRAVDAAREAARTREGDAPLAWRFALVTALLDALFEAARAQAVRELGDYAPHAGGAPEDHVRRIELIALPFLPFVNEFAETLAVPRMWLSDRQFHGLVAAAATPNGDGDPGDAAVVLAQVLAPLAGAEWRRHREDVLWDPDEAKKRAKEEDERKNKEALAAKFAHVKDDPNKPEVEL